MTQTPTTELLSVVRAMRDYIDALPSDVVASLPTMPGFDRDWADEVIEAANREAQPVGEEEINAALRLHRLKVEGHSQLSDAFRAGFKHARRAAPPAPAVPRVTEIPEAATLTNINQLCPLDNNLSQTDFATGWNDCLQYAITNGGVPPVAQGWHSAAQGWNACRAAMLAQPVSQGCKLNSPEIPDGCQWTFDEHDYKWDSDCGEAWMFSDGGPTENGVKFCQGCGKPVLLAAAPEITPIADKRQTITDEMKMGSRLTKHRFSLDNTTNNTETNNNE